MSYMSYSAVRNARYLNQANTRIECEVNFDSLDEEWTLFACTADIDEEFGHTHEIFNRCVAGDFGDVQAFSMPSVTEDERLMHIRGIRQAILREEVDPIMSNVGRWESLGAEKQQEWRDYRQALLDLTETCTDQMQWNDEHCYLYIQPTNLPTKPE